MNERHEVGKSSENTGWRGPEGAQAYLTVRRAPGGSMPSVFGAIDGRSRLFMNSPG